ncbi:FMN-dependent NADH-azoreductase [Flocculibacter collagenilyticus]|uniref:FMN-dependent NADH-azoreductase n=1 Tax=Flocculibacter collagenilyticus TaxID=2744479 RepID=UPI0018F49655|nr:NAD(P)H-dependent oxidoreductase [Flocculibacter collagenilyticus]
MKTVLFLDASINGELGNSSKLTQLLRTKIQEEIVEDLTVINRDLTQHPIPHLSQAEMRAWMTPHSERTIEQEKLASLSDELLKEVELSDLIVVGMPMYNFGVPSTFKSYIDRIARAGKTFKYTEQGPVGLLKNKKVIVMAARGGIYQGTDKDTQTKFLSDVFAFIGLTDIEFVYAEGLAMGESVYNDAFEQAKQKIDELVLQVAV